MAYATIILELFKSGIHVTCEDIGLDDFVKHGDGKAIMDIINEVDDICDPDARFCLTEKGRKLLESGKLMEELEKLNK